MNAQWGDFLVPVLAIALVWARPSRRWLRAEDWPLALYLFVTLVTAAISEDPAVGLKQLVKQLFLALIFVVFRQLADEVWLTRILAKTFVLSLAAVTLVSILAVFLRFRWILPGLVGAADTLPFLGLVRRLRGGFVTPEMLGNALVLVFALALACRAGGSARVRAFWTGVAALLAAGEFLTFSHSVAGFAMTAALFVAAAQPSRPVRVLAWAAALSVVVTVNAASLMEPGPAVNDYGVRPVSLEILGTNVSGELNHYAALKQVAWSAFLEHPLKGLGPGRFPVETERAFQEGRFKARYRSKPAQCDLLGRLGESGILGGVSLVLLWVAWLRQGLVVAPRSIMQRAAFAAVVGLLVNSLNADVMNFRFLWLAVAWMGSKVEGEGDALESGRPGPVSGVP